VSGSGHVLGRVAGAAAAAGIGVAAIPSLVSLGPVRRALTPAVAPAELSGISDRPHIALTFDDGPDVTSTPSFLRLLDELGVTATFFVLGRHLGDGGLLRELAAAGHGIGVHGWDHRPVALHSPRTLRDGLVRSRDLVEDTIDAPVRWYRPPYGLVTATGWWAAGQAGLRTVLWSAWGRDWEHRATPSSVTRLVTSQLRPGGTVLLHDSDRTSSAGSWRTTLVATEQLVHRWQQIGLEVGGLDTHWSEPVAPAA
jgi:peptidoglycan/xylan/chitin deacetylase (PgdA/CDA1 family)